MTRTAAASDITGREWAGKSPDATWALASLAISVLMPSLDTSIANVALPAMAASFAATFPQVQWIVLAYLLAVTALIVSAGGLGDRVGRKRLLLTGIAVFTVGSLLCGVATTLFGLIAARAVQGVGAALMLSLTLAFVGETVGESRRGSAMGLLGTMSAIGTTLGPSLGGLLLSHFGWPMIFLVNVPLGVANFWLAAATLPADGATAREPRARFDVLGTVLLGATLATYALSMTIGRGSFGRENLALLGIAIAGGAVFTLRMARAASPLVPLAMLGEGRVRVGLATSALVSTVMMATLVVGPFYLNRALDLGAATVGLVMSIGPLVAALAGLPAGRLVDRLGTARMTTIGLAVLAAGLVALAVAPALLGVSGYIAAISVVTASYALFQAANNTAVTRGARPEQRGVIAGLLGLARNIGLITGASVMGAIFAAASASADVASAPPGAVATGMRTTFLVAALLVAVAFALAWRGSAGVAAQLPSATPPPRAHGTSTAHLTDSDHA